MTAHPRPTASRRLDDAHPPKTAALLAYAEGALSDRGRARVDRHLAACGTCRRTLAAIQTYESLVDEARETPLEVLAPHLDAVDPARTEDAWRALSRRLPRRRGWSAALLGEHGTLGPGWRWGLSGIGVLFLALAASLGTVDDDRGDPTASAGNDGATRVPQAAEKAAADSVAPESPPLDAWVLAGTSDARVAGRSLPTSDDDEAGVPRVRVGDTLEVSAPGGFLDVAVATPGRLPTAPSPATGLRVLGPARVHVDHLDQGGVTLRIAHGTLVAEVAPVPGSHRFRVLAGTWQARVLGTRFEVRRGIGDRPDLVEVVVDEGQVGLSRRPAPESDGAAAPPAQRGGGAAADETILEAPTRWSSSTPGRRGPTRRASRAVPGPWLGLADGTPLTAGARETFQLEPAPEVDAWLLGTAAAPPAPVRLYARAAHVRALGLALRTKDGRRLELEVGDRGGPIATPSPLTPSGPIRRMGTLPKEEVAEVVRRGRRQLRRCYDRALRVSGTDFSADLRLGLRIARTGEVRRADVRGVGEGEAPPAFRRCVEEAAQAWHFPAPDGGPVDVEVPFRFDPR
jgi:anti-sigma factor RsiW